MTNISKAVNRLVVVCMLSVMIFLGIICNGAMQANAACGNWTTYKTGSPYCVDKGCDLFWLSDTEYQKAYLKQVCTTSSGTTNTNYDVQENRLGCC